MKYSLSDYSADMQGEGVRIEVYQSKDDAAKLVAMYGELGFSAVPLYRLIPYGVMGIPSPKDVVGLMKEYIAECGKKVVFIGLDGYLVLLNDSDRSDFFIGLRGLVDYELGTARFLISARFDVKSCFANPRYWDSLQIVELGGDDVNADKPLSIKLIRNDWCISATIRMGSEALKAMDNYCPAGEYVFALDQKYMPQFDYGFVSVLSSPEKAMMELYQTAIDCGSDTTEQILLECAKLSKKPLDLIIDRYGEDYLTTERAPKRLSELVEDPLWPAYIWLLKSRIKSETYLYAVLRSVVDAQTFLKRYVVDTAISVLGSSSANKYAEERKMALVGQSMFEPLIANFVSKTEADDRAVSFLNCGTDTERKAIIRHARHMELTFGLPDEFVRVDPIVSFYLATKFDYGDVELTDYFHELRCFRMADTITEKFVGIANNAVVPSHIRKRDDVLQELDDGETALLIVDGMGAEYYPLLLNMAKQNGSRVKCASIVSVKLPTSTEFNHIKWNEARMLQEVKGVDNTSHNGASAHERCTYDENLADVFNTFQRDVFPRIAEGLRCYKRVVVTADHGSSYLAVIAHREHYDKDLPWSANKAVDWRYTVLDHQIETPDGMMVSYVPDESKWYYVVKGYNRLNHRGGKPYAVHGGASLEELLVPLVVFTIEDVEEKIEAVPEEFIENDAFDLL